MRLSRFTAPALAGLGLALFALVLAAPPAQAAPDWRVTPEDMVLGNPKARITVIEYASASCPHCARFNNEVFPAFKAKYIDTGQVRFVMREFLTPPYEVAAAGFLTARCGGKAHYFPILDQIFRHQEEIYRGDDMQDVLHKAGQAGGLSPAQVDACVMDGAALAALNGRIDTYAKRDEITATPSLIVNGQPMAAGEPTLVSLEEAIAAARKAH